MRRSDRWAFAVLGVGVAATLGGVQLAGMLDDPSTPLASEYEFCPERPGGGARSDTRYGERGEPYRGDGPHPVALNLRYAQVGNVDVPDQWKSGEGGAPPGPQLVACVYQDTTVPQKEIRECLYWHSLGTPVDPDHATKVSLLKASYVVHLYEAESAEPVGRIDAPGAESCPAVYKADSGGTIFKNPIPRNSRRPCAPTSSAPSRHDAAATPGTSSHASHPTNGGTAALTGWGVPERVQRSGRTGRVSGPGAA
ncbi:hypothetical protein [Actinomadura sp. 7K507]|uniref:hypothetical protein n=1 Tax=Actinomadura sp. 7K507 TaxID=2530365 RepID=UPI001053326B|nr:hypothetical protein [Actinomadura sp. 7K507]TDC75452.1 hypothetical protein E1285_41235 [Actinomadura sp. 7K507]